VRGEGGEMTVSLAVCVQPVCAGKAMLPAQSLLRGEAVAKATADQRE